MTTKWTIETQNGSISEQYTELGRVILAVADKGLRLYIIVQHFKNGHPLVKVVTELSKFCGITDSEHGILLSYILTEQNLKHIEGELRRRGIVFEPADPEEAVEVGKPTSFYILDALLIL